MTLGDYLLMARENRWAAGVHDCTTFPANWVLTWGLGDAMGEWRGQYDTDEGAMRLVEDAGGIVALFGRGLSSIGAVRAALPAEGDIGVIRAVGMDGTATEIGAIWTGRRWAFRIHNGVAFASAECVAAWGRPCPRR